MQQQVFSRIFTSTNTTERDASSSFFFFSQWCSCRSTCSSTLCPLCQFTRCQPFSSAHGKLYMYPHSISSHSHHALSLPVRQWYKARTNRSLLSFTCRVCLFFHAKFYVFSMFTRLPPPPTYHPRRSLSRYVFFSWAWLRTSGVVYYPFMDPSLPWKMVRDGAFERVVVAVRCGSL